MVKVWGWPEVQFYQAGLNPELVAKALIQDDPEALLGWMQLASEVGNCEQGSEEGHWEETRSQWVEWEQCLHQGLCLKCGAKDHFTTDCGEGKVAVPEKPKSL